MTTFIETRLNDAVEKGARGGPGFSTTVLELSSGHEHRNRNWRKARAKYNISYGISNPETWESVLDAFTVCGGRAVGFRFKDWSDYVIDDQSIGFGTMGGITEFQVFKRYTFGGVNYDREINKLVTGTLSVTVNDVSTGAYTVDLNTGIITFNTPKLDTQEIKVSCEFDVPVRFDQDELPLEMQTFQAGSIGAINIIEIRVNTND